MTKTSVATIVGLTLALSLPSGVAIPAPTCPEVEAARASLGRVTSRGSSPDVAGADHASSAQTSSRNQDIQARRDQNIQAPRGQSQELQAPRDQQGIQAPRNQDVQSPRSQDQAPRRSQDIQAPRNQDSQAPRGGNVQSGAGAQNARAPSQLNQAAMLVKEAETACQAGKTSEASQKAQAAMALLQK